jgi:hypothetical protein
MNEKGASVWRNRCLVAATAYLSLVPGGFSSEATALNTSDPPKLLARALMAFKWVTNFVAAVDIVTVDNRRTNLAPTLAKETWHFAGGGQTNVFTRTRYLPLPGKERLESTNYSGGNLIASKSAPLPDTLSLPGFELYNLLAKMSAGPTAAGSPNGTAIKVTVTLSPEETQIAWFAPQTILPYRVEKRRGGDLLMVYTRTPDASVGQILPLRDVIQIYENGRIAVTVTRSFSNANEALAPFSGTN